MGNATVGSLLWAVAEWVAGGFGTGLDDVASEDSGSGDDRKVLILLSKKVLGMKGEVDTEVAELEE